MWCVQNCRVPMRWADNEAGIGVCRIDDTYALQGFAKPRLVANDEAFLFKSVCNALALVGIRLDAQVVS